MQLLVANGIVVMILSFPWARDGRRCFQLAGWKRVQRDEDYTKGMMLKFLCKTLELHPELIAFLEQVGRSRRGYDRVVRISCFHFTLSCG